MSNTQYQCIKTIPFLCEEGEIGEIQFEQNRTRIVEGNWSFLFQSEYRSTYGPYWTSEKMSPELTFSFKKKFNCFLTKLSLGKEIVLKEYFRPIY